MGENDFKVRCVRASDAGDENDVTKAMMDAYKSLKAEGFTPVWMTPKECLSIKRKEKNCVYLFDPFQGPAFDHIKSLCCRILGPNCILESLEYKLEIPRKARPVYNLAMRNVVACCTNLDKQTRDEVHEKIELMSGSVGKDFTEAVTHLIAGEVGSKKYQVAATLGKQIMSAEWVYKVWEVSQNRAVHGMDGTLQEYRCPIFKGLVITVSGLDPQERNDVKKLINSEGGKYTGEMKVNECTHLIINKPKGTKFEFAKKWKLNIVRTEWLYDSISKGFCQETEKYKVVAENDKSLAKTSTPEKDVPHTRASTIADLSCIANISVIGHINETAATTTTTTHKSFDETDATLNGIDLTQPSSDLFLDGCKVYLSGFRGVALEKVRKVINAGGGTRLNQLNENVTHVIVGEQVDKDLDFLKTVTFRPHVVKAVWLAECFKQGHTVDEQPYICLEYETELTTSPKIKGKPAAVKETTSTLTNDKKAEVADQDEDMDDIMSQYLLQANPGGTSQDETVLDEDQTQDPNAPNSEGLPKEAVTEEKEEDATRDRDVTEDTEMEGSPKPIFRGKSFMFFGFEDDAVHELTQFIVERRGRVLDPKARMVPDYAVVPLDGFPVDRTVSEVVTNAWLQICLEHDTLMTDANELYHPLDLNLDPQQLSGCVLSISGYSGTERDCLVHIAEVLGATCQDYFVRKANKGLQPSTHLIVREAEGSKYEAAKKWNIPAVSNSWLFACAKSGKREKEEQYHIDNKKSTPVEMELQETSVKTKGIEISNNISKPEVSVGRGEDKNQNSITNSKQAVPSKENTESETKETKTRKSLKRTNSKVDCPDLDDDQSRPSKVPRVLESVKESGKQTGTEEDRPTDKPYQQGSQKENMSRLNKAAVNDRVKALQAEVDTTPQGGARFRTGLQTPSPGRFLDLSKEFHPVFDLTDAMASLETPEGHRKVNRRKTSLPLDELYTIQIEKGLKNMEEVQPEEKSPVKVEEEVAPLHGVTIVVNKKLLSQQSEFNNIVSDLGGDYRWSYDNTCTHYIFQGRSNDTTKEFRLARDQGKIIVSPHWIHMCKEQNARVDESLFPHTFNPNLSLSVVSSKRTETPGRASRRSGRAMARKEDDTVVTSSTIHSKTSPPKTEQKSEQSSTKQEISPLKAAGSSSPAGAKSDKSPKEEGQKSGEEAMEHEDTTTEKQEGLEIGGTLELREVLSKQLEKMMGSKAKKSTRRKSKRLNSSGQMNMSGETSGELSGEGRNSSHSRPPSRQNRWSLQDEQAGQSERRNSRQTSGAKSLESNSGPEASQSVQITWDDPTGRLEEEKLAHKLERACSPTQDPSLPPGYLDAEFSEVEEEEEEDKPVPNLPSYGKTSERNKEDERIKTPEAPALAFPRPRHSNREDPSESLPKATDNEEKEQGEATRPIPVFLLSGVSQEEKDHYGALVEQLGGQMLDGQMYNSACTHLVIGLPSRNEKFLASVASGKWVLHKSYFEACQQEGKFVAEALYEWGGEGTSSLASSKNQAVVKLAAAAHSWRVSVEEERKRSGSCLGAFSGWKVLLCADPNKESSFRRLLAAGGATVLTNKPPFPKTLSATHAFIELSKYKMSQEDLEVLISANVLCLRPDFIAAHLTDSPPPRSDDFCPPEVAALIISLKGESSGRRKLSSSSSSSESRRRRTKNH